jgi:hypothetical protein
MPPQAAAQPAPPAPQAAAQPAPPTTTPPAPPPAPADEPRTPPPANPDPPADKRAENDQKPAEPAEAPADDESAAKEKRPQFPVLIKSDPTGTRVSTGRHVFGTTPLTLKLRPGNSYELTFNKAGYAPLSRRYHFDEREPQTLRVTLKKAPEPRRAAPSAPAAAAKPAPPAKPEKKSWFGR